MLALFSQGKKRSAFVVHACRPCVDCFYYRQKNTLQTVSAKSLAGRALTVFTGKKNAVHLWTRFREVESFFNRFLIVLMNRFLSFLSFFYMFGGQLGTSHDQFSLAERPLAGLAFVGDDNCAARASLRGIQLLSTVHFACQRENHNNTKSKGGTA